MKKIFIAATDMAIGGAERALLGLLNALDKEKYQIDLFLLHHSGPLMELIPKEIRLLPEIPKYADLGIPIQKVLKHGHLDIFYGRLKGSRTICSKTSIKKRQFRQHSLQFQIYAALSAGHQRYPL